MSEPHLVLCSLVLCRGISSLLGGYLVPAGCSESVIKISFKVNGFTVRGRNSIAFILPPFSVEVNSERKEFAPRGANSFL